MEDFAYTIKFKARDKETALRIMDALAKLIKNLPPEDLTKFANVAENQPEKIQLAKNFI